MLRAVLIILYFVTQVSTAQDAESAMVRTWRSSSGKTLKAEFVKFDGSRYILKSPEGKLIKVRKSALSSHDLEYIEFHKHFQSEKYYEILGLPFKPMEFEYNVPVETWLRFMSWKAREVLLNSEWILEIGFPSESHFMAYSKNPITAVNMKTLEANKIDLYNESKSQWFMFRSRDDVSQIDSNLYKARLSGESYADSIYAYFTKAEFDSVLSLPDGLMGNAYGPGLYYVYGRLGEHADRKGLLIGELAMAYEAVDQKVSEPLSNAIKSELEMMDDSNWKEIRDKLLRSYPTTQ